MAKLFVICGHGAGDPGACGNGYQEAERVRALGKRIKELGGNHVILGDMSRNYYADNGISNLTISKDYQIVELHMDSASATARGAHVIIKGGLNPDKYDTALAKFVSGMFPGRSVTISKRSDLANPARAYAKGYGYRLIECGFISNAEDVKVFNSGIDKLAKGILECFGIGVQAASKPTASKPVTKPTTQKTIEQIAQEVLAGKWGNGNTRKQKLKAAGYDYNTVQAKVNELCGVKTKPTTAKPKPVAPKKQTVTLPASAPTWRVYPLNVAPVVGNECGMLAPARYNGLTYEILAKPQKNFVKIQTHYFGKVKIEVGKGTGAIIK